VLAGTAQAETRIGGRLFSAPNGATPTASGLRILFIDTLHAIKVFFGIRHSAGTAVFLALLICRKVGFDQTR